MRVLLSTMRVWSYVLRSSGCLYILRAAEHSVCEVLLVLSHGLSLVYVLLGVVCLSLQLVLYCGALFIHRDTTIWAYASPCRGYCLWLSMYWATRGVLLSISMYSSYSQRVQVPARMQARPIETR